MRAEGIHDNNQDSDSNDSLKSCKDKKAMPIRWMSIEAIEYSKFTTKCDVVCMCLNVSDVDLHLL